MRRSPATFANFRTTRSFWCSTPEGINAAITFSLRHALDFLFQCSTPEGINAAITIEGAYTAEQMVRCSTPEGINAAITVT